MDRRVLALASTNPDINDLRAWQINWIKLHDLPFHQATREDIAWFWEDLDIEIDSDTAKEYVAQNLSPLNDRYAFLLTEFFEEFYRYMPDALGYNLFKVGPVDWNLFFTLAFPLPPMPCTSFRVLVNKLNWAQLRLVKEKIMDEVWDSPEYRRRALHEEALPALYTQYIPYPRIRKEMIRRFNQYSRSLEEEKRLSFGSGTPEWLKAASRLVEQGRSPAEAYTLLAKTPS